MLYNIIIFRIIFRPTVCEFSLVSKNFLQNAFLSLFCVDKLILDAQNMMHFLINAKKLGLNSFINLSI